MLGDVSIVGATLAGFEQTFRTPGFTVAPSPRKVLKGRNYSCELSLWRVV
jgi:hypothetical protein